MANALVMVDDFGRRCTAIKKFLATRGRPTGFGIAVDAVKKRERERERLEFVFLLAEQKIEKVSWVFWKRLQKVVLSIIQ